MNGWKLFWKKGFLVPNLKIWKKTKLLAIEVDPFQKSLDFEPSCLLPKSLFTVKKMKTSVFLFLASIPPLIKKDLVKIFSILALVPTENKISAETFDY